LVGDDNRSIPLTLNFNVKLDVENGNDLILTRLTPVTTVFVPVSAGLAGVVVA